MFAVVGRGLFYRVAPTRFGTLGRAFFTLFQLITLDDWFEIYTGAIEKEPSTLSVSLIPYSQSHSQPSLDYSEIRMAGWLDHSTLVQRVLGSKPLSDLENLLALCVSRQEGKSNHEMWSQVRKDQGRTAQLVYLFHGPFVLST